MSSISSTVSLPISTDTVFIHSLTFFHLTSKKGFLDSSFELTVTFRVVNVNQFGLRLNAKYPVGIDSLGKAGVNVFIYNRVNFANYYIDLKYQVVTFTNLGATQKTTIYTAPFIPTTTNNIVFGMNGMDLSGFLNLGFTFTINPTPLVKDYTFTLKNLWAGTSIPRLDFLILLPTEFRCPNN